MVELKNRTYKKLLEMRNELANELMKRCYILKRAPKTKAGKLAALKAMR